MGTILIVGADAGGNVPPAVAIAAELASRGHEAVLAGHGARAAADLPDGAGLIHLRALADHDMTRATGRLGQGRALLRMGTGRELAREVAALIASLSPDAVVVDCMMLSSLRAALASSTPTVALFHSFGAFMLNAARPPLNAVAAILGLPTTRIWGATRARILPTDRELDPAGHRPSPVDFDWVGTTERGVPPEPRNGGEPPLVLVSLSSAWTPGQSDAYRRIVSALADLPVRAIVTTGGAEIEGVLSSPPNVEIREREPHGEILPRVDLVIGHGGHSTTMKTLAHGVPMLILPMNPASDQPLIARTVEAAGLGVALSRRAFPARLREAVAEILADTAMRDRAAAVGERLRAEHGARAAADLIESRCGVER
ncbi:MAG: glycosyltransferase [Leucobacter sp.]